MTASTKDLIERIRGEQALQQAEYGRGLHVLDEAADALERLTQPVGADDVSSLISRLNIVRTGMESGLNDWPTASQIWEYQQAAEMLARLQAERDEAYAKGYSDGVSAVTKQTSDTEASDLAAEFSDRCNALQEQVKMLREALSEAVKLRVSLWRHGDMDGDDDALSGDEVAKKEPYAKKWLPALAATEPKEKTE